MPSLKITDYKNEWTANLEIYYHDAEINKIIENSFGTFEIKDNQLTYYRTNILEKDDNIEIPTISNFAIKNQKLILKENYLNNYEKSIILK